jgi:hypothetical protein
MSTLHVVEEVLRERRQPMVVREIVEVAGSRLPTRSRTPDTVVARDLAMDIKRRGGDSLFARVAPGKYTLKEFAAAWIESNPAQSDVAPGRDTVPVEIPAIATSPSTDTVVPSNLVANLPDIAPESIRH